MNAVLYFCLAVMHFQAGMGELANGRLDKCHENLAAAGLYATLAACEMPGAELLISMTH